MKETQRSGARHGAGISLTEIIVVITIILVPALLAVTATKRALASARSAKCVSNLRDLGAAALAYASEDNGCMPPICQLTYGKTWSTEAVNRWWPSFLVDASSPSSELVYKTWRCPEARDNDFQVKSAARNATKPWEPCSGLPMHGGLPRARAVGTTAGRERTMAPAMGVSKPSPAKKSMTSITEHSENTMEPKLNIRPITTLIRSTALSSCWIALTALAATVLSLPAVENAHGFNVRDYGATADGIALDHHAFNKAIEAAASEGGGLVRVPAGNYLCGSIRLKSRINLHLDAGAVIIAAPNRMNAYDETEDFIPPAYQDGGHTYFRNSLIWGENLDHVSITGTGMIDGRGSWNEGEGLIAWNPVLDRMGGCASEGEMPPPKLGADGKPLPNNGLPPVRRGNKALALKSCKNVLIRDVTISRGGHFAILATGCDNMTIDNLTIDTDRDGIDIDCCRNVMVSNCRINAPYDDAITPKSSYALGELRLTENLMIVNCMVSGFEVGSLLDGTMVPGKNQVGRIKFGTESSGGFRNVTIANCTFRCSMGLALQSVDGGILENFTISNISMTDVRKYGIHVTTGNRNRTPGVTTPSRMRNVRISNVVMDGVDKMAGIILTGMPGQSLENICLDNIRMTTKGGGTRKDAQKIIPEAGAYPKATWAGDLSAYGIFARHIKGLELADIHIDFEKPELRPAASFENIDGLLIDNFKARVEEGVETAVFADDVSDVAVSRSPGIRQEQ